MSSATPDPALVSRLQALESALQCPLCHALPTAPVALSNCGHHFCSACIRAFLSYEGHSFCPQLLCKAPATTTDFVPMPHLDIRGGADADFDRRAPRLPQLIGASAGSLRKKLADLGVPATGDLARLEGRHKAYVNAYNVSLDGGCGASRLKGVVLSAVRAWDKAQDELAAAAAARAKQSRAGVKRGMFRKSAPGALLGKRPLEDGAREMTSLREVVDGLRPDDVVRAGDSTAEMARKIRRAKEARRERDARATQGSDGVKMGSAGGDQRGSSGGEVLRGGDEGKEDEVIVVDGNVDSVDDGVGGENGSDGGGGDGDENDDVVVVKLFESDNSVEIPMPPPSPRGLASGEIKTPDGRESDIAVQRDESDVAVQRDGMPLSPSTQCKSDVEAEPAPMSAPASTCAPAPKRTQNMVVSPYFSGCARAADGHTYVDALHIQQECLMNASDQSPVDVAHALNVAAPAEPSEAEVKDREWDVVDLTPAPQVSASSPRPSGAAVSADEILRKREIALEKLRKTKYNQEIARKREAAVAKQMQARQRRLMEEEALRRRGQASAAFPGQGR